MTPPALSIVVVVHRSSRQARLVLESLSPDYQRLPQHTYDVLVVEVDSDDRLGREAVRAAGPGFTHVEVGAGPAWRTRAITLGVQQTRAPHVGLCQDGAHVVTPGVVGAALDALRERAHALVTVADYLLDGRNVTGAGDPDAELTWLAGAGWREAPYRLFDVARYGPAAINGPLSPILGASVMFFGRDRYDQIPGIDPAFDLPGTGALRLHLFTQLCRLPRTELVALVGEGAFRVTHPEVATERARWDESSPERTMVSAALPQGPAFRAVHREPRASGAVGPEAQPHVERSASLAEWHCAVCRGKGEPSWFEDPP